MCNDQPEYYKVIAKRLRPFKLGIDNNSPYYNDHLKCLNDVVNNMPLDNELINVRLDIENSETNKLVFNGTFNSDQALSLFNFTLIVLADLAYDFNIEITTNVEVREDSKNYIYSSFEYGLRDKVEEY